MSHRPHALTALLTCVLVLTACTSDPPAALSPVGAQVNAPKLPAQQFSTLPDRGPGATTSIQALAGDGRVIVMQATVQGGAAVPVLRSSVDGGVTWRTAQLTEAAAQATQVGEWASGLVAVSSIGQTPRWLALGGHDDTPIAWTSDDAQVWSRRQITGVNPETDQFNSVVGMPGGGFIAVGRHWTTAASRPRVWRSDDGVAWRVLKLPGRGALSEVAVRGDRLVAVGSRELTTVTKGRSQLALLFTSADQGASWRPVREPSDSGDFAAWLSHVVATEDGFVVGGSYFDQDEDTYQPLLLRSTGLRAWRALPRLDEFDESSGVGELVQVGGRTLVAQTTKNPGSRERVLLQALEAGATKWRLLSTPVHRDSVTGPVGVALGDGAVLAVGVESRPSVSALWTVHPDGAVTDAEVTPPPNATANVQPFGLLVVNGAVEAYGSAQGASVLWHRSSSGFGVPTVMRDVAGETVDAVHWNGTGGFLATGTQNDQHAFVLDSSDGINWRRTQPKAFNSVAQYHYSSIDDATWGHGRWVVVGEKSSNGSARTSALAYTSPDAVRWVQGTPTTVTSRGDYFDPRAPLDDLHGLESNARSMSAVLALPKGLVAVGEVGTPGHRRPAAWVSGDNRRWRLVPVSSPGYTDAAIRTVQMVDGVLLGLGWVGNARSPRPVRATWRSTDGGRHWTFQAIEGNHAVTLFAASDHEFLQLVLADDHRSVTLHRSTDGLTWAASPVTINGLAEGMQVDLFDAVVCDGTLQVLIELANRLDAVRVLQTVPL
ncbi:hypothetical protein [Micropruina sp.]|uniref:hypothetical protein n=1 Tax=Micropruina sp. TaxID=2737536 RepID=UPI0039E5909A